MAGGKLEVQIGADITDFEKKIKEVEFDIKELSKVKLDRLKLGLDTTEINNQIKDAKTNLRSLQTAVKDTGQSFTSMSPKVANGGNALMQFSRIAQDAPFGIIGIGNNITATVEAFGSLKNSTGSTGGALKALASSIMGTGGILLGVSLLTTGLTLMAQSGLSVQDVINKITGNFDEFGAALKKANEEAVKNSAAEISGMNALVSAAKNVNLSMNDRLIAVKELQSQYPAYFGNLSKEQILNGNVETAVKGVTDALIAKAKAQAYTAELVKLSEEEFKLEEEKNKLIAKQIGLRSDLQNKRFGGRGGSPAQVEAALQSALTSTTAALEENQRKLTDNTFAQQKWTERINESVAASLKLRQEIEKPTKTFNTPQVTSLAGALPIAPNVEFEFLPTFTQLIDDVTAKANEGLIRLGILLQEFDAAVNDLIQNSISTTFASLGTAIGEALTTGGDVLSAIGSTLINALAGFLSQLGDKLIQYGLLLAAFGKAEAAFIAGDPVTKIGAGLAMVALGIAVKAASGAVSGAARTNGGGASTASGSGANNTSFTSSGFSSRGDGGGTVVFEIAGQKLIGVLSNTINANRRLGGQLGLG